MARTITVYLYIPNIIGYIRILMNIFAFAICFSDRKLFSLLYFIRISTACLLVILSQVYRPGFVFMSLLALDIASHWLQMYSTFLVGKASHKDVKDSTSWLFRAYYRHRMFMAYCCVACEVLYITLFLLANNQNENIIEVLMGVAQQSLLNSILLGFLLFGWAIKQSINVIQMKTAADLCVLYDINKKSKD